MALNRWDSAAVSAVIAGTVIFFVSILTSFVTPVAGAILWSVPFSSTALVIGMYLSETESSVGDISKMVLNLSVTLIPLFAWLVTWGACTKYVFGDKSRTTRIWASYGLGAVSWLVLTGVFVGLVLGVPSIKHALF